MNEGGERPEESYSRQRALWSSGVAREIDDLYTILSTHGRSLIRMTDLIGDLQSAVGQIQGEWALLSQRLTNKLNELDQVNSDSRLQPMIDQAKTIATSMQTVIDALPTDPGQVQPTPAPPVPTPAPPPPTDPAQVTPVPTPDPSGQPPPATPTA